MALRNPTTDPPYFSSPTKRSLHSRSPSRSPTRQYRGVRHLDPLLRDLSPTATIRAFSSQLDGSDSSVNGSFQDATHAQRVLGIKAAQTCLNLRSWVREIEAWEWPGSFETPEPARKKQRTSGLSIGSIVSRPSMSQNEEDAVHEYWGSLPSQTVQAHQRRVDNIGEAVDEMDLDELKGFVLSAHSRAGYGEASVDDSIGAIGADTDLKHLDDFTALVTATILQTLPYLSRVNRLLDSWSIRLSILRGASTYLRDLGQARTDMDHGWAALAVSSHPAATDALQRANATFSRDTMVEMKTMIERQVHSLGRRLDGFLDMLEGRTDCVPDRWIGDFEELEGQYGNWVVQAERKVLEGEWRVHTATAPEPDTSAGADEDNRDNFASYVVSGGQQLGEDRKVVVGPTVVTSTLAASASEFRTNTITNTTSSGPRSTVISATAPLTSTTTHTSVEETTTSSARSSNVPTVSSTTSSPQKQRHVPIVIDGYADTAASAALASAPPGQQATVDRDILKVPLRPSLKSSNSNEAAPSVKKRAAFLNGDIEKPDRLNKSKPAPIVRPFEHASNAFTRLFKRDREKESADAASQSSSVGSRTRRGDTKAESRSKMGYADLFTVPNAEATDDTSRTSYSGESRPRTPKKVDPRVLEYVDMVRVPHRTSSDRPRSRSHPKTPSQHTLQTADSASRSRSASNRSKRSSTQNMTALPAMTTSNSSAPAAIVEQQGPQTYLPTGLTSPFHSPIEPEPQFNVPENWPLSNEATPTVETEDPMSRGVKPREDGKDVEPSNQAIRTDAFEDMFVVSIESPTNRPIAHGVNAAGEWETRFGDPVSAASSTPPRTSIDEGYFYQERPAIDRSLLRTGRSSQNVLIGDDDEETTSPRPVSMVMEADEEEPADPMHTENDPHSRFSETPPASKNSLPSVLLRSKSTPPVSPRVLRLRIPSESPGEADTSVTDGDTSALIRRASTASIETFPRSRVRSIEVVRRNSTDAPQYLLQTPLEASRPNNNEKARATSDDNETTSPLHYKDNVWFPSPPASPPSVPPRGSSLGSSTELRRSVDSSRAVDPDDLSSRISKSRQKQPISPRKSDVPLRQGEDTFDRHVSEVLDRVHANIKFRTRPGSVTPLSQQRLGGKLPKANERSNSNMVLAPAESSPRKTTTAGPEVKLYHLTEAGRSEPIKLYVRLVGESERVMVRVGGGWADLAEYLRQYAEHHGSRTVSEGGVQLQTASSSTVPTLSNGFGKRTFSGPATSEPKARGSPITPISGPGKSSRPGSRDTGRGWLDQEQPTFSMGDSDGSANTSPVAARQAPDIVPDSPPSSSSRPSTAYAASQGSALRQVESADNSPSGHLSMAGPGSSNKTKADLPEQKARWVEGMIERVNKSASAEKTRAFADIGKVGGTRRIAFRKSSSGADG